MQAMPIHGAMVGLPSAGMRMRFALLGPLLVATDAGDKVALAGPRVRSLLAALLARSNEPVSFDALIEAVWDGAPPPRAATTLRSYVMRLRHQVGPAGGARIVVHNPGYLIRVYPPELDILVFEMLCGECESAARANAWADVAGIAARALDLWRGTPLIDVPSQTVQDALVPRLQLMRLQLIERRVDAEMRLGLHDRLIPQLRDLTTEYPLRERFHAHLMLALARSGRTAEALESYQDARQALIDGLGIEPGADLRGIQERILAGDRDLLAPGPDATRRRAAIPAPPARLEPPPSVPPEPGAGIPPDVVAHFVGRVVELADLQRLLARHGRVSVHGLSGVGKTQMVARYLHARHAEYPDGLFWLRADRESSLVGDLATLSWRLGLPERELPDQKRQVEAVLRWLHGHRRWLLVLDNLEARTQDSVLRWLPPGLPGHLIVTSRTSTWPTHLALGVLAQDVAVQFLLARTAQADADAAGTVAETLGCLPLALAQAAAYMVRSGRDLASYAHLLQERLVELLEEGRSEDYPLPVATTLRLSYERMADEHPPAAALLGICAFLGPEDIPVGVLRAGAAVVPPHLHDALADDLEFDRAVTALRRYSLVDRWADGLRAHRLTQAVVRECLRADGRSAYLVSAIHLLKAAFPEAPQDNPESWPLGARLLPHVQAVEQRARESTTEPGALGCLLDSAGRYLWARGEFGQSQPLLERALKLREAAFGADHPDTAATLNSLGLLLGQQGRSDAAKPLFERALATRERALGPNHPATAESLNGLASLLWQQGELAAAKPLSERALAIRESSLGPDHPNVANLLNNLANLLRDQGDLTAAQPLAQRALSICERECGPDHPYTALVLSNLGWLLREQGDPLAARPLLERASAIRERVLGPDHPQTAHSLHRLAVVLDELEHPALARTLLERAVATYARALPPEHQWTIEGQSALARITGQPTR
jgi:DNA-binding SARP family transcriptional activator/tetratricopeptide (TPR) repeat protein